MGAEAIIFLIAAVIGGVYFIKKFTSIDRYFFSGGDPDYEPSGNGYLMTSVIIGALGSILYFGNEMFRWGYNGKWVLYAVCGLVATVTFASMIVAIVRYERPALSAAKAIFMFFSCFVGALMGVAGSVILFIIVCLWMLLAVLGGLASGNPDQIKRSGTDLLSFDDGELTHEHGNVYSDRSGNRWERDGDTVTRID